MKRKYFTLVPAVYVLFRDGDKILFIRRANTGYRDGDYSVPAGHVEGNEPYIRAAVREAEEEVGIRLKPSDLTLVHTQHRTAEDKSYERINLFFETTSWQGDPVNAEPEKCSEIRWMSIEELPSNLVPELKHLFENLKTGSPYGHFGF